MAVLTYIFFILVAFLILMFMITIHELGHYTAGKVLKFKVNEFSIGMGPKIFSRKTKDGGLFSLRWIPLGGYCAFEGEDEDKNNPEAFNNQKPWKRLIVLFSGALFNIVSALLIVLIAFLAFGDALPMVERVYEDHVSYSNSLDGSGLMVGDVIYEINGKVVLLISADSLSAAIEAAPEVMDIVVIRNGKKVELTGVHKGEYTHELFEKNDKGAIVRDKDGKPKYLVKVDENGEPVLDGSGNPVYQTEKSYGLGIFTSVPNRTRLPVGDCFSRVIPYCGNVGLVIIKTLGSIFTGNFAVISGPVGTIKLTSEIASTGFANILFLITIISINLGIFNLLPIPALDGSRMVFVVIEWILKRPVINRKTEGLIHFFGLVVVFALVIVVDIVNLVF